MGKEVRIDTTAHARQKPEHECRVPVHGPNWRIADLRTKLLIFLQGFYGEFMKKQRDEQSSPRLCSLRRSPRPLARLAQARIAAKEARRMLPRRLALPRHAVPPRELPAPDGSIHP